MAAQPHIRVRGRGAIAASLTVDAGKLKISGQLTDEAGNALPGGRLDLRIEANGSASRTSARSDDDGTFEHWFELLSPGEDVRVSATFESNSHIDGVETSLVASQQPAPPVVHISLPAKDRIDLDQANTLLEIALADGAGAALTFDVRDERGGLVGSGTLVPGKPLHFSVPSTRLGTQGYGRVLVMAAEGGGPKQLVGAIDVLRYRTSQLRLLETSVPIVAGTLAGKRGQLLAQQAVTLLVDGARVATVLTDEYGKFSVATQRGWSEPWRGPVRVEAVHESASPWWIGGRSNTIVLAATSPPSAPWWPVALLGAASVAGLAWRQRRAEARHHLGRAAQTARDPEQHVPPPLGNSTSTSVHGTIVDAVSQSPIRDAIIQVANREDRRTASDAWGRFYFADLPRGHHALLVRQAGYEEQRVHLTLPHSGRWHNVVLRLRSLRSVALAHYRRGAPLLPGFDDATQTHTAQELLAIHEHGASDVMRVTLRRLTHAFEAAYYAGQPPTETLVELVRRSADDAEQERRTRIV